VKRDDDLDERRREVALFRHAVIADLDFEKMPPGERSERIRDLATRTWQLSSGEEDTFSERTLWSWWSAYRKGGLQALMPKARSDRGVPRILAPALLEQAIATRKDVPTRSTATVIDVLVKSGVATPGQLKRSTLDRHLAEAGHSRRRLKTLGTKRFIRMQMERPNQLWIGDYHEARILWYPPDQRWLTVHMGAIVDHYSKVIPHAQWYRNEQLATLEDTVKKAILKRGLPERFYVDRGSVYRSADFAFALDQFGIRLVHSKAYAKEARGAIERLNRTVVDQFEPEARAARIEDIDRLNHLFEAWIEQRYHLTVHEATGMRPIDRFDQDGFQPRFPDPTVVQDTFRVRRRCKVHPKTSTVEVQGVNFLVETFLRGRWVTVYYDPHRTEDVLVFLKRQRIQRAFPARPNEPPLPTPESPQPSPPAFDYLGALRAEYDRRIVAEVRKLSLSQWTPTDDFTLPGFLAVCAELLGKDLSPYERDELTRAFHTVGPLSETTTRLALQHAVRLRGRGLHVSVYAHYLKVFHLEAHRGLDPNSKDPRP
jgi:transposase InsO family protein